jgi:hypothetical protein
LATVFALLQRLFGTRRDESVPAPEGQMVVGILHPLMASGGRAPSSTDWTLHFTLEEWRAEDGVIRSTPLPIHRLSSYDEMRIAMDRVNRMSVVGARVRMLDTGSAELIDLVDLELPGEDPLQLRAAELARVATHQSERFGTLRRDRALGRWDGNALWCDERVELALEGADLGELGAALESAERLWSEQEAWSERIQAFAVDRLLELKNESWLDEGEAEVTAEEFRRRMRLELIVVWPDGRFTFWHQDGDLFWGHSIQVVGTLAGGPTAADIPG